MVIAVGARAPGWPERWIRRNSGLGRAGRPMRGGRPGDAAARVAGLVGVDRALLFPVALALALNAGEMPAWPFGVGFVVLYLFFSNTARERVPLYLSNKLTTDALLSLMHQRSAAALYRSRFGSRRCGAGAGRGGAACAWRGIGADGLAGVCRSCRKSSGGDRLCGRTSGQPTCPVRKIWSMPSCRPSRCRQLFDKARTEMKSGSLLVSNSFRGTRCRGGRGLGARRSAQDQDCISTR
jgi:hypothetical protein